MPRSNERRELRVEVLLGQFTALRSEIASRSASQANLIQLNVTGIGVLGGIALSEHGDERLLLLIPVISTMLGLLWLDHAANIFDMGDFIMEQIMPKLASEANMPDLPDWEVFVRQRERQLQVKVGSFGLPPPLVFAVAPACALLLSMKADVWGWLFWTLFSLDVLLIGVFMYYLSPFVFGSRNEKQPEQDGI